jgi:hypothetical protein
LLYAGAEIGVLVSFDDGEHWQPLQHGLPTTPVHDLSVHGADLIAATHGRGFWILDDVTPLRQAKPVAAELTLCSPERAPIRPRVPSSTTYYRPMRRLN